MIMSGEKSPDFLFAKSFANYAAISYILLVSAQLLHKSAIITGASRGIGAAVAELCADEGSQVFLIGRKEAALISVADSITASGGNVHPIICDITHQEEVRKAFNEIGAKIDKLDILVNTAAILEKDLMEEIKEVNLLRILEVNLLGAFRCCQAAINLMKDSWGSIINISSLSRVTGVRKFPGMGAHIISKYGLWGLTEILSVEWAKYKIRVNAISPSGVDTPMFRVAVPGAEPPLAPIDIAKVCLYLASDDSASITGENINVSGLK